MKSFTEQFFRAKKTMQGIVVISEIRRLRAELDRNQDPAAQKEIQKQIAEIRKFADECGIFQPFEHSISPSTGSGKDNKCRTVNFGR